MTSWTISVIIGSIRDRIVGAASSERGATAVEYALMVGLIAAVIVAAVTALGGAVLGLFTFDFPS